MKRLFEIELLKLRKNKATWIIVFFYALISIFLVYKTTRISEFVETDTLSFPMIWLTGTYVLGFLVVFPAIIVIINTVSEFNNKTSKQHIIDGLSKNEFVLSKLINSFLISSFFTIYVFLLCLFFGIYKGNYNEFFGEQFSFILGYFLYLFGILTFAQIICFIFKKTGISLAVFLLYYLCIEPILFWNVFENSSIKKYLPLEIFDSLLFSPIKDNAETVEKLEITKVVYHLEWESALLSLVYISFFIFIIKTVFSKRDI